jgi:hypothetical protein
VYCKVITDETEVHNIASRCLSYQIENHKIIARKQYSRTKNRYWLKWDGTKSLYDKRSRQFLTGLLPQLLQSFYNYSIQVELYDTRKKPSSIPDW